MIALRTDLLRCSFCSKQKPPHRIVLIVPGGQIMCDHCYDWHGKALAVRTGQAMPDGCMPCGRTIAELNEMARGVEIRLYVVPRDGIYQVMCRDCKEKYVPLRRDLYAKTTYAKRIGLN